MNPLSQHFSWEEACVTEHRNIDNSIPIELLSAIKNTALGMERIRAILNSPIRINSWYRNRELSIVIGSNPDTSQHPKGEAVDWTSWQYGSCLDVIRRLIKYSSIVKYDQLIFEHAWIHTSFTIPPVLPRLQVLTLLKSGKYANGVTDIYGVPLK